MIKIERTETTGWKHAVRGMRNPMNSWDKSDSGFFDKIICDHYSECPSYAGDVCMEQEFRRGLEMPCHLGPNDYKLMMELAKNDSVHAKYRRMISVYADITAPLYWWKEFDTYKVGTVANSCSTMHKIQEKEFVFDDFSFEGIKDEDIYAGGSSTDINANKLVGRILDCLNALRDAFLRTNNKSYWYQMIQLLPSSYNQKRTVMMNYEVLAGIYIYRKDHKLDEWRDFCKWIETLPYSEIITLKEEVDTSERP